VSTERDRGAASTPFYSPALPTEEKFMRLVEEEQLRERPELIRLVGQCSILVVIAGIVAGLIAA
jgi:hypothetical protein